MITAETVLTDYASAVAEAEKAKAVAITAAKEELASLEERRRALKSLIGRKARTPKAKKPVEK